MTLSDKKIAILGAGRSGLSAARLILKQGGIPHVFDINPNPRPNWPKEIDLTTGATEEIGHQFQADLVIISPGMEITNPFVQAFAEQAEELIGEIELAYRFYKGTIIAITGTNGKTTTTELIERILLQDGKTVKACGNYGYPFTEVLCQDTPPDYVSLELSSFQLETIKDFHPKVALFLNFAPDHMDRYTKLEDYYQAKCRIFENQTSADTAILRANLKQPGLAAHIETFSSDPEIPATLSYHDNAIFENDVCLLSLEGTKMNIKHNAENVMAAILCTRAIGISMESIKRTLQKFAPPLHRCELIRILDGIEYCNDSKATNIHAVEAAIRSQIKPIILIAGGKDKGLDYHCLRPLLKEKVRSCVVFGQIKNQLEQTFSDVIPTYKTTTLEETILKAKNLAQRGDIILFSPGTSSFDMFTGYEQRGDKFREFVLNLN